MINTNFYFYGERLLLTLWVGSMWTIGYIVAPVLFKVLVDRQLAGMIAGKMFEAVSFIGIFCGVVLLISGLYWFGKKVFKQWRIWILLLMLVIIGISAGMIQPMMQELKLDGLENQAVSARFGMMHGVSSVLYLINSLLGLILVLFGVNVIKKKEVE
jgi:MFS family permease